MQIVAELIEVTTPESGTSKSGKEYVKCHAIVQTKGNYPKKIAIELFGQAIIQNVAALTIGSLYKWDVNVESRESNGNFYTKISLWRVSNG